jgi:hypothetical protein
MPRPTDGSYSVTTSSALAAANYRRGVRLLTTGAPGADVELDAALRADERLAVAYAALSLSVVPVGEQRRAVGLAQLWSPFGTRRERQHVEIVAAVLGDDVARGRALMSQHLVEYPADRIIRYLFDERTIRDSG